MRPLISPGRFSSVDRFIASLNTTMTVKLWWKLDEAAGAVAWADSGDLNFPGAVLSGAFAAGVPLGGGLVGVRAGGVGFTQRLETLGDPAQAAQTLLYLIRHDTISTTTNLVGHTAQGLAIRAGATQGSMALRVNGVDIASVPSVFQLGWLHSVVCAHDGTNAWVYVDGIQRIAPTAMGVLPAWSTGFGLGSAVANAFGASVAHVAITNAAFTADLAAGFEASIVRGS